MISKTAWVTACIPTFRCTRYLRNAVESLLNQTHPFLRVVVINDGDPKPPWPALADIKDPRLIRFNLPQNRGPYFALEIALEATPDSLFLIQDADDWSAPQRVATLLRLLRRDGSQYAFSTLVQFHDGRGGKVVLDGPLCRTRPDTVPGGEFRSRIFHHGLFRNSAVRNLGGFFGGFRFSYDMLLTNLLLLCGTVSWTPEHLYWRRLRSTSLTRSPSTGLLSKARRSMRDEMEYMYRLAVRDYQAFASRRISGSQFLRLIQSRVQARRGTEDGYLIRKYATTLREAMNLQAAFHQNEYAANSSHLGRLKH